VLGKKFYGKKIHHLFVCGHTREGQKKRGGRAELGNLLKFSRVFVSLCENAVKISVE